MDNISRSIYEKAFNKYQEAKEAVSWVQERLNYHGYRLTVDGIWGDKTENAVRQFQKTRGLVVDGIVGKDTRKALEVQVAHFKDSEFKCKCPGWCNGLPSKGVSKEFLLRLEQVRAEVNKLYPDPSGKGRPVIIRSGYRCERWNKQQGGAAKSQHMISNPLAAADILVPGVTPNNLGNICDRIFDDGGVGLGGATIVHVDNRGQRARWWYN